MLEFVSQQKFWKWANTCFYVVPVLQPYGFIQICFGFFVFVLSNKYYLSKLMLLDFRCQKISFLCKHSFCIDEKHTQWHCDTKVKVFHESISWFMKCSWNCISWNDQKEKFQCILPLTPPSTPPTPPPHPPRFLTDNIKMGRIPTKIKCKIHAPFLYWQIFIRHS